MRQLKIDRPVPPTGAVQQRQHREDEVYPRSTMVPRGIPAIVGLVLLSGTVPKDGFAVESGAKAGTGLYLVELADPPLLRYDGSLPGLRATAPQARGKIDLRAPASSAYLDHLDARQDAALSSMRAVLGAEPSARFRYRLTRNGFALRLDPGQARQVAAMPGVLRVEPDTVDPLLSLESVAQIGAPQVWDGSGTDGLATRGEGLLVGVIDTGINFDHPAFAATAIDGHVHVNPFGAGTFRGWCAPTHPRYDPRYRCNGKLVGAWDFADGITVQVVINGVPTTAVENDGPVDDNGHGSATASIAAGNANAPLGFTGTARRASLIAYDACISLGNNSSAGVCPASAQLAAIEQAILDGVDVINFSIGGGRNPWSANDRSQAFLDATAAGVFVSTGTGNTGPGPSTVFHLAPLVSSSGASVKISVQPLFGTVSTVGSNAPGPFTGLGLDISGIWPTGIPESEFVYAGDLPCFGPGCEDFPAPPSECFNQFPPGAVRDKILICDRRGNSNPLGTFIGATGLNRVFGLPRAVIVANVLDGPLPLVSSDGVNPLPDYSLFLTLTKPDADALKLWVRSGAQRRGRLSGVAPPTVRRELLAGFSSRGPNPSFDVIKPDLVAPGQSIAAATPGPRPGLPAPGATDVYSGTSFAAPHVTGAAALIRAVHPDWTPAQILSSLVLTTEPFLVSTADVVGPLGVDAVGAGRIDVARAVRTSLVLDESIANFRAADPALGGQPRELNLASMSNGACVRSCTWTRRMSNPGTQTRSYAATGNGPSALGVSVTPATFTLAPGASQTLQITVTATPGVAVDLGATAEIVIRSAGAPDARMPIRVGGANGVALPSVLPVATGGTGSLVLRDLGSLSASGTLRAALTSVVSAAEIPAPLAQDPTPNDPFDAGSNTIVRLIDVPASGVRAFWLSLEATAGADLDLWVGEDVNRDGLPSINETRCAANGPASSETCILGADSDTRYWVVLQNFSASAQGVVEQAILREAVVPNAPATGSTLNVTVPASTPSYTPFDATLTWNLAQLPGRNLVAVLDLGDATDPARIGSATIVFTRDQNAALFRDGFE